MRIIYYQINAFTGDGFQGNPAGVCLLDKELDDQLMQQIARENNLSETAFVVKTSRQFAIRWFTPSVEVDLCGHATLSSAKAIFEFTDYQNKTIRFLSKSGLLEVTKEEDLYKMNFPADTIQQAVLPAAIEKAFQQTAEEIFMGKTDYLLIFRDEESVRKANPDMNILGKSDGRGVIITARGDKADFVSRFFAPQSGIPEDPVTGSAHTTLVPYWSKRLNKTRLLAHQVSERGGELHCINLGNRVEIAGKALLYLEGHIIV